MDQLDLLKKDWKKQESSLPKLSYDELTKLIHKKSSSIVKWIFIISVLEFVLPFVMLLFPNYRDMSMDTYEKLGLTNFINILYIVVYIIVVGFIFLFYKNYRSISANSNPKTLMYNIIKTRRIVKYYIWFNLALVPIIGGVTFYKLFHSVDFLEKLPEDINTTMMWIITIFILLILVGLVWLFYRLLYGILLNKLNTNYNELVSNGNGDL